MTLEKPKLFSDKREFVLVMAVFMAILIIRLFFSYTSYQSFISKPFYYLDAKVMHAYEKKKHNKSYTVLKLKSTEGLTFYTTSYRKEDFSHSHLRLQIFPNKNISFQDYLGYFYVRSKIKKKVPISLTLKDTLLHQVASQHQDEDLKTFYNAIFFATGLSQNLREKVSLLGVSHLVALSGFHIGILWAVLYGLLLMVYRPFQQMFFPYRHALLDVGLFVMLMLGVYLWFVDIPPSLLRAYTMVFLGWLMLLVGIELLSFTFLITIVLLLLSLFPALFVSLGFWLSVAGVFYIFLILLYARKTKTWIISFIIIPLGIFMLMLPVVHSIFATTSGYQLLSPLLSILFIGFYPLVMVLHLLGVGDSLDTGLLWLFNLPMTESERLLDMWVLYMYVGLSLFAIWSKVGYRLLLGSAGLYMVYLFISIE